MTTAVGPRHGVARGHQQAKGVLIAQRHMDADRAFEVLRDASQCYNRELRDIAAGIVESAQRP